jgi:hypothetical protein
MVRHLILCLTAVSVLSGSVSAQESRLIVKVETPGPFGPTPLHAASVTVSREDNRVVASGTTNSDGLVVLAIPNVRLRITASAVGYFIYGHAEVLPVSGDAFFTLTMLPLPEPDLLLPSPPPPPLPKGMISGRVISLDGAPISNARVELPHGGAGTVTKDDGSFHLVVPLRSFDPPTFQLRVSPRTMPWRPDEPDVTYEPEPTEFPWPVAVLAGHETRDIEIRVRTRPRVRVTLALRDERGGVTSGATVTVSGRNHSGTYIANDDGTVTFTSLPGPITVDAIAIGVNPRLAATVQVNVEDKPLAIALSLRQGARVTGRVVFRGFARPLHGGHQLQLGSHAPGVAPAPWSSTDLNGRVEADGTFVLDGLVGPRCLLLTGVPYGWVVGRIQYDAFDITDVPGSFEAGQAADIVITVVRAPDGQTHPHRPTCGAR